jgi:hypothetical protein
LKQRHSLLVDAEHELQTDPGNQRILDVARIELELAETLPDRCIRAERERTAGLLPIVATKGDVDPFQP